MQDVKRTVTNDKHCWTVSTSLLWEEYAHSWIEGITEQEMDNDLGGPGPYQWLWECQHWEIPKIKFMEVTNLKQERLAGRMPR